MDSIPPSSTGGSAGRVARPARLRFRLEIATRALLALALLWSAVWAARSAAAGARITVERIRTEIEGSGFADWSRGVPEDAGSPAEKERREAEIRRIGGMIGRLDYAGRIDLRRDNPSEALFSRLSGPEKRLFVELTVLPAMNSLLLSIEKLTPGQRRRFLDMARRELDDQGLAGLAGKEQTAMMARVFSNPEAFRGFLPKLPPEALFHAGPLVEAVNDALQGMAGHTFGPGRRNHSPD